MLRSRAKRGVSKHEAATILRDALLRNAPRDEGEKVGAARRYIMAAVEASLKRLDTDWIDLYQQHRPDPRTPIEETLRALDDLVHQGKVLYIAC